MLLNGIPDLAFGFHAQQAIEKLLKALIAARGEKYPRTHDLEELATLLVLGGEPLPPFTVDPSGLTLYALDYRYGEPLPNEPPERADIIATVAVLRKFVHRRVQELDAQP